VFSAVLTQNAILNYLELVGVVTCKLNGFACSIRLRVDLEFVTCKLVRVVQDVWSNFGVKVLWMEIQTIPYRGLATASDRTRSLQESAVGFDIF